MSLIVLATSNPNKVVEIEPLLNAAGYQTKLQTEFFSDEVEEDGLSFVENAIKKARFASAKTGFPAIADDSGLEVDALGGQPGIYSARYANDHTGMTTEQQNLQKVLDELGDLPYEDRTARYSCVVVYVDHADDPMPIIGFGHWYGEILKEPRTDHGIGYDPIFWVPKLVKTLSEVPLEVKNKISHRAKAIHQVLEQLEHKNKI
ncbi:RdgB/HAM1 family non-canonical purine NTP pyrophosphatase [Thiomicrorhabdus lithotrophica]|uniref:dITP/XTP pyrophosphatase n=1 Tax=Thiomicrorhabdus lithotrophica TaxID=2949997 RepID=A0ABY8CAF5_9GAMM|nr:RdgB/HAM1 family non-canonical purine NTP pyrophosphatase [Thiomicrorhabdus lithotrophica]WEJ62961.1 RdgB/HAM1 family non-canonical purine NTP pyrophosphatase [Thiomicrorhabdus lithotrophica]